MFPLPFTIPSWAVKALGILAVVLTVGFAVHAWVGAIKHSAVAEVNVAAEHHARTVEVAQAKVSVRTSTAEANAQAKITAQGRATHEKVRYYVKAVPVDRACVPYGLLRVLDAAGLGLDPASVQLPAGQSDDACAPLSPPDFAAALTDRFTDARANAEQLNALQEDLRQRIDAANGTEDNRHVSH